jgi:hypothetical protein
MPLRDENEGLAGVRTISLRVPVRASGAQHIPSGTLEALTERFFYAFKG